MKILFFLSAFFIIYTMIIYPIILKMLDKVVKKDKMSLDLSYEPNVSIVIPVYNEEKVIRSKLENLVSLAYPKEKLEIIITSDNSSDNTNCIVREYSEKYDFISLVEVKNRMGKTNAQDEAVEIANGEVIVFSDANSILHVDSIKELISYMVDERVGYVTGKLQYVNSQISTTAASEGNYWNYDLEMRRIESEIASITAGNGAIYAVRKSDYEKINPIYSHDSVFPPKFVLKGKKAKFNPNAIAYEKAGERLSDEFKRKIRMSRKIIRINFIDIQKYNIFKYGYFSFFYFSHRFCRNFLYLFHMILIISNLLILQNTLFKLLFICQVFFYLLSIIGFFYNSKLLRSFTYYSMTILAQGIGAFKEITGKSKPFWEVVEGTR